MCATRMTAHTSMAPPVETDVMYSNAFSGTTALITTPMPMTSAEITTVRTGTPRPFNLASALNPSPLTPAVRSIRDVEYSPPALQDDSAAVSTTKLTMSAPPGIPIWSNASTNGLAPPLNSVHGTTDRITSSDPM